MRTGDDGLLDVPCSTLLLLLLLLSLLCSACWYCPGGEPSNSVTERARAEAEGGQTKSAAWTDLDCSDIHVLA